MPNWCSNKITLKHDNPEMVDRAQEALGRGELLNEFFPCPPELHEHVSPQRDEALAKQFIEKYGAPCWYDWQVQNWGTKWDVGGDHELVKRTDPNTVEASFDSAWSPPTTAYEKLCALGFKIKAYYYEPGMAFCGVWEGDEDDVFDDYYDYGQETSETVRDAIGAELDDMYGISEQMAEYEEDDN